MDISSDYEENNESIIKRRDSMGDFLTVMEILVKKFKKK